MEAVQHFERTEPYLRPHQVRAAQEELDGIVETLRAPPHVSNQVQDRGAMQKQAASIKKNLDENTPVPYPEDQVDAAVARELELREKFVHGMPTQAEMRRNPSGAVDKHRGWERRFKPEILEWKNLRLRLHAGGHIDDHPDARQVANIEQFRPAYSPTELNMHGEQIVGQEYYLPTGPVEVRNVMDKDEAKKLRDDNKLLMQLMEQNPTASVEEFRKIMADNGLAVPVADDGAKKPPSRRKSSS